LNCLTSLTPYEIPQIPLRPEICNHLIVREHTPEMCLLDLVISDLFSVLNYYILCYLSFAVFSLDSISFY
jgi:hypothetical protein